MEPKAGPIAPEPDQQPNSSNPTAAAVTRLQDQSKQYEANMAIKHRKRHERSCASKPSAGSKY